MLTGALAASYYGSPRTTMDIDIIVKFAPEKTKFLATQLKKAGLRVNERKINEAFKSGFKIVTLEDEKTPFTVDVILSDGKLMKRKGRILGLSTHYQIPEALILSKLRMIKVTVPPERALKDKDDVRAILKYTKIDLETLKKKASKEKTLFILEELIGSEV